MSYKLPLKPAVFIGNFLDEEVVDTRKLQSLNSAGSNRMWRLTNALLAAGILTYILSPASSVRMKFDKRIFYPAKVGRKGDVIVIYAPALAIPYLSVLFELIAMVFLYLKIYFNRGISITLMYCYYPSTVLVGIISKLFRVRVVEDLEDVVTPRISDLSKSSTLFSLQQFIGYFLMHFSVFISDLVIVPSSKFIDAIKFKVNHLVVDGCISIDPIQGEYGNQEKMKVLLGGLLDNDQGLELFLSALSIMNQQSDFFKLFQFSICGVTFFEKNLVDRLKDFDRLDIKYHGHVSQSDYSELVSRSDVCLVLQNPNGRNAMTKTPSKGYEYMAYGKAIIVSDVGDYFSLPADIFIPLVIYTPENLVDIFKGLNKVDLLRIGEEAKRYAAENWRYDVVGKRISDRLYK